MINTALAALAGEGIKVPEGTEYAWRPRTVKNWEWEEQIKEYRANGWHPVPAERHKGAVELDGWVLMERRTTGGCDGGHDRPVVGAVYEAPP